MHTPQKIMTKDEIREVVKEQRARLDKECTVYHWNGVSVVDSGTKSPCGMTNSGSEIVQVVENIISNNITTNSMKASNISSKEATFEKVKSKNAIIEKTIIKEIASETTDTNVLNVINTLNVGGATDFGGFVTFNAGTSFGDEATFKDRAVFETDVVVEHMGVPTKTTDGGAGIAINA